MPFHELMKKYVFDKLSTEEYSMQSTFNIPSGSNIAVGHNEDGGSLQNQRNVYPEQAAAGLYSTPTEMVVILRDLIQGLNKGDSKVLTLDLVQQMLTPQTNIMDEQLHMGLGMAIVTERGDPSQVIAFEHTGCNAGFRTHLTIIPSTGQGLVVMTDSENGDELKAEIIQAVALQHNWRRDALFPPLQTEPLKSTELDMPVESSSMSVPQLKDVTQLSTEGTLLKQERSDTTISATTKTNEAIIISEYDKVNDTTLEIKCAAADPESKPKSEIKTTIAGNKKSI